MVFSSALKAPRLHCARAHDDLQTTPVTQYLTQSKNSNIAEEHLEELELCARVDVTVKTDILLAWYGFKINDEAET